MDQEVKTWLAQSLALDQQGNVTAAEEFCRRAISRAPNHDEAHFVLASIQQRQGKIDAAIASTSLAIDLAPENALYFNFLGACYLIRKESVVAELCFRRAIALQPAFASAHNNLGLTLLNKKRVDESYPILQQAVKLAPHDVNALCNLGRACQEQGMLNEALAWFEQACLLQPQNATALTGKATTLRELRRFPEAMAIIDNIAFDEANKAEILRHKAVLLNDMGRADEACAVFDGAPVVTTADEFESVNWRAHARKIKPDEPFFRLLQELEPQAQTVKGKAKTELCFALAKTYQDVGNLAASAKYYAAAGANVLLTNSFNESNDVALFDAIKRFFTTSYISSLAGAGIDSERPIFILGMERSGTTLIEQMLACHPQVFACGELPYIGNVLHGFLLPDGTQFADNGKESFEPGAGIKQRADRYLQKIAVLPGNADKARFTDKMPDNFKNLGLIRAMFPHARIIHCRRDPVDNCISSYTTQFKSGNEWSFDLATMGRRYRRYWDLMAHWRHELPGRFLELRYEQVVDNTEEAARTLLEWCGLSWDDRVLRFYENDRKVNTASVRQVRQPIYKSSVGRWKKWEPYIQPLLAEIGDIEKAYWDELEK